MKQLDVKEHLIRAVNYSQNLCNSACCECPFNDVRIASGIHKCQAAMRFSLIGWIEEHIVTKETVDGD